MTDTTEPEIGNVYILTNCSMPGIIKIGMTTRDVTKRMEELWTTGVPSNFECYSAKWVKNPKEVERKLHFIFDRNRVCDNREFFRVPADEAHVALSLCEGDDTTPERQYQDFGVADWHSPFPPDDDF